MATVQIIWDRKAKDTLGDPTHIFSTTQEAQNFLTRYAGKTRGEPGKTFDIVAVTV